MEETLTIKHRLTSSFLRSHLFGLKSNPQLPDAERCLINVTKLMEEMALLITFETVKVKT